MCHNDCGAVGSVGFAGDACPDANRCGNDVAGQMSFFFGLAGPETVFVVATCELLASEMDDAVGAQAIGLSFPTGAGLWAFCPRWEEKFGVPTAVGQSTPIA